MRRAPLDESTTGLLGTKIVPPAIPRGFLRRARLEAQLDTAASGPVTLICAGPGWGKTLMVAAWARSRVAGPATPAIRVSWLALDADDNEPRTFWSGVVASLRASGAVPMANPLATLEFGAGVTANGMQRLRQGIANLPGRNVLVLDDLHVVDNPEILQALALLLRHELPLRLVLISRTDPVLPLHRLRVAGALHDIRARHLAFDHHEAAQFLRGSGENLPDSDIARLVDRTEGWPVGLRLAAMFLSRQDSPGQAEEFAGDDGAVAEYLLGEVIASQPEHMRDFLLHTSIPDRICADLADVLVEGRQGQRHLEELERADTFITSLGPHRLWYRYHPLLREALAHQLRLEQPERYRSLHRLTAVWFAANGEAVQGLRHAAEALDWRLLGDLFVTTAGPGILSAERQAINEVLARIPESELTGTAALQACAAARLEYAGRLAEIAPVLARARRMLEGARTPESAATSVTVTLWEAAVGRTTGDMPALLRACESTLSELSETDSSFPAAEKLRAIAANNHGVGLLWTGRYRAAYAELSEATDRAREAGLEVTRLNSLGHLAMAAVTLGLMDEAEAWSSQGLAVAEERGWTSLSQAAASYLALGLVELTRGHPITADQLLQRASAASQEPLARVAILIAQALADISSGRPQGAVRSVQMAREMIRPLHAPDFITGWLALAEAEAALAVGEPGSVDALLKHIPEGRWMARGGVRAAHAMLDLRRDADADRVLRWLEPDHDDPVGAVELWLTRAIVADHLREDRRAGQAIGRAVQIAAPARICRPFIAFDAARVRRLLGRLSCPDPSETAFVREIGALTATNGHSAVEPARLSEPLTERELTVLHLLPSMQSNDEIAEEMFVSVNTVKVHLKTLYRKLDVPNRRSAVRRSRALGLIP